MMTDDQHKDAASKLIAALKNNTNGAYDQWTTRKDLDDPSAGAEFVQSATGLSQKPSPDDLAAIQKHIQTTFKANAAEVQAKNPPQHVVGAFCMTGD